MRIKPWSQLNAKPCCSSCGSCDVHVQLQSELAPNSTIQRHVLNGLRRMPFYLSTVLQSLLRHRTYMNKYSVVLQHVLCRYFGSASKSHDASWHTCNITTSCEAPECQTGPQKSHQVTTNLRLESWGCVSDTCAMLCWEAEVCGPALLDVWEECQGSPELCGYISLMLSLKEPQFFFHEHSVSGQIQMAKTYMGIAGQSACCQALRQATLTTL